MKDPARSNGTRTSHLSLVTNVALIGIFCGAGTAAAIGGGRPLQLFVAMIVTALVSGCHYRLLSSMAAWVGGCTAGSRHVPAQLPTPSHHPTRDGDSRD